MASRSGTTAKKAVARKGATPPAKKTASEKPASTTTKKTTRKVATRATRRVVNRPYPRRTLEDALNVPRALKDKNGGNAWPPTEVANALSMSKTNNNFFYLTAASRDFKLTDGTRDAATISLTPLGRRAMYPGSPDEQARALAEAYFNIEVFDRVVRYFGGSKLPEKEFLSNTLQTEFGLDPSLHDEFIELFEANCRFLGIGPEYKRGDASNSPARIETLARPTGATSNGKVCFIAMPFAEKSGKYQEGFFDEVLASILTPAVQAAGFEVRTAKQKGSDVIQSTIVTELLDADLVLADLTEHNPNVLFELGMRMMADKPVALVRAKGTGAIFDVDNLLRVEDYNPNLWKSTVETDIPLITEHLLGAWDSRDTAQTFLKILYGAAGTG